MSVVESQMLDCAESVCETLSMGTSSGRNPKPHRLPSTVDHVQQCQFILDSPHPVYDQKLASYNLEQLVTQGWDSFAPDQKLELEIYVLDLLTTEAQKFDDVVADNLKRLAKRLTRLNSMGDSSMHHIPSANEAPNSHRANFPIADQDHAHIATHFAVPGFLGVAILDMEGISSDLIESVSIEFKLSSEVRGSIQMTQTGRHSNQHILQWAANGGIYGHPDIGSNWEPPLLEIWCDSSTHTTPTDPQTNDTPPVPSVKSQRRLLGVAVPDEESHKLSDNHKNNSVTTDKDVTTNIDTKPVKLTIPGVDGSWILVSFHRGEYQNEVEEAALRSMEHYNEHKRSVFSEEIDESRARAPLSASGGEKHQNSTKVKVKASEQEDKAPIGISTNRGTNEPQQSLSPSSPSLSSKPIIRDTVDSTTQSILQVDSALSSEALSQPPVVSGRFETHLFDISIEGVCGDLTTTATTMAISSSSSNDNIKHYRIDEPLQGLDVFYLLPANLIRCITGNLSDNRHFSSDVNNSAVADSFYSLWWDCSCGYLNRSSLHKFRSMSAVASTTSTKQQPHICGNMDTNGDDEGDTEPSHTATVKDDNEDINSALIFLIGISGTGTGTGGEGHGQQPVLLGKAVITNTELMTLFDATSNGTRGFTLPITPLVEFSTTAPSQTFNSNDDKFNLFSHITLPKSIDICLSHRVEPIMLSRHPSMFIADQEPVRCDEASVAAIRKALAGRPKNVVDNVYTANTPSFVRGASTEATANTSSGASAKPLLSSSSNTAATTVGVNAGRNNKVKELMKPFFDLHYDASQLYSTDWRAVATVHEQQQQQQQQPMSESPHPRTLIEEEAPMPLLASYANSNVSGANAAFVKDGNSIRTSAVSSAESQPQPKLEFTINALSHLKFVDADGKQFTVLSVDEGHTSADSVRLSVRMMPHDVENTASIRSGAIYCLHDMQVVENVTLGERVCLRLPTSSQHSVSLAGNTREQEANQYISGDYTDDLSIKEAAHVRKTKTKVTDELSLVLRETTVEISVHSLGHQFAGLSTSHSQSALRSNGRLLARAVVDLSTLGLGVPCIHGWYELKDARFHTIGQIQITAKMCVDGDGNGATEPTGPYKHGDSSDATTTAVGAALAMTDERHYSGGDGDGHDYDDDVALSTDLTDVLRRHLSSMEVSTKLLLSGNRTQDSVCGAADVDGEDVRTAEFSVGVNLSQSTTKSSSEQEVSTERSRLSIGHPVDSVFGSRQDVSVVGEENKHQQVGTFNDSSDINREHDDDEGDDNSNSIQPLEQSPTQSVLSAGVDGSHQQLEESHMFKSSTVDNNNFSSIDYNQLSPTDHLSFAQEEDDEEKETGYIESSNLADNNKEEQDDLHADDISLPSLGSDGDSEFHTHSVRSESISSVVDRSVVGSEGSVTSTDTDVDAVAVVESVSDNSVSAMLPEPCESDVTSSGEGDVSHISDGGVKDASDDSVSGSIPDGAVTHSVDVESHNTADMQLLIDETLPVDSARETEAAVNASIAHDVEEHAVIRADDSGDDSISTAANEQSVLDALDSAELEPREVVRAEETELEERKEAAGDAVNAIADATEANLTNNVVGEEQPEDDDNKQEIPTGVDKSDVSTCASHEDNTSPRVSSVLTPTTTATATATATESSKQQELATAVEDPNAINFRVTDPLPLNLCYTQRAIAKSTSTFTSTTNNISCANSMYTSTYTRTDSSLKTYDNTKQISDSSQFSVSNNSNGNSNNNTGSAALALSIQQVRNISITSLNKRMSELNGGGLRREELEKECARVSSAMLKRKSDVNSKR